MKYDESKLKEICEKHDVEYVGVESRKNKNKYERYIKYICNKHREFGIQEDIIYNFKRFKHICKYCNGGKLKDVFRSRVYEVNPNIEILSDYKKWNDKVKCKCVICSYEWDARPSVILYGGGCPKCGRKKANLAEMTNRDEIVKRIQEANPDIEVIGKYYGYHKNIKCRCLICGKEWESPVCHLISRESHCPSHSKSKGEKMMCELLQSFGYNIKEQYSFNDCRYKYPLKFDAYVEELNALFEYQGEYHYMPINYAGKDDDWVKQHFEISQHRDNIKREYCKKNNISLIEVPYWEKDNMESFLLHEIKKINGDTNDTC